MRVQAASVCICLVLLLPPVGLRAAPEDGGQKNVKDEKWIVVTGQNSGRFVWAAFSLREMEPDANGPVTFDVPEMLINTLLNNLGVGVVRLATAIRWGHFKRVRISWRPHWHVNR